MFWPWYFFLFLQFSWDTFMTDFICKRYTEARPWKTMILILKHHSLSLCHWKPKTTSLSWKRIVNAFSREKEQSRFLVNACRHPENFGPGSLRYFVFCCLYNVHCHCKSRTFTPRIESCSQCEIQSNRVTHLRRIAHCTAVDDGSSL